MVLRFSIICSALLSYAVAAQSTGQAQASQTSSSSEASQTLQTSGPSHASFNGNQMTTSPSSSSSIPSAAPSTALSPVSEPHTVDVPGTTSSSATSTEIPAAVTALSPTSKPVGVDIPSTSSSSIYFLTAVSPRPTPSGVNLGGLNTPSNSQGSGSIGQSQSNDDDGSNDHQSQAGGDAPEAGVPPTGASMIFNTQISNTSPVSGPLVTAAGRPAGSGAGDAIVNSGGSPTGSHAGTAQTTAPQVVSLGDGQTLAAVPASNGNLIVDGTTLVQGGPVATIHGHVMSLGSSGALAVATGSATAAPSMTTSLAVGAVDSSSSSGTFGLSSPTTSTQRGSIPTETTSSTHSESPASSGFAKPSSIPVRALAGLGAMAAAAIAL